MHNVVVVVAVVGVRVRVGVGVGGVLVNFISALPCY